MKKQLDIKKLLILNLPYLLMGLFATNFGEAWRMVQGADASQKALSLISVLPVALASWWPSLHPLDLLVGLCCGAGLRLAVYLKSKNAKKYRHGMEYGSARWGTHEDIAPYVDPVFQNNVILTKTESLTMNSRPKDPKTARNKNVLVIGGSGSGKTRFWLKPNLMQMHSSYVVTDPKGSLYGVGIPNSFPILIIAPENISISVWRPESISCNVEYLADALTALPRPDFALILLKSIPFALATASTSALNPSRIAAICSLSS